MKKNNTKLYAGILIVVFFAVVVAFFAYAKEESHIAENKIQELILPSSITSNVENSVKNNLKKQTLLKTPPAPKKTSPVVTETLNTAAIKPQQVDTKENSQSVMVLAGEVTLQLSFSSPEIFYDVLVKAKNGGKIEFSGKEYPGLGFFVTDIGSLHAGGGKDLLYYINGKEANVGVSSYILRDGDIIEWKLK